jgi:hypothetical protein
MAILIEVVFIPTYGHRCGLVSYFRIVRNGNDQGQAHARGPTTKVSGGAND